nr:MAG TPA: hypothetical protein [Caudoviricetes sp.]DAH45425.1 MAG TPA: hypothetical protein [Caudoviricetes sp.]
MIFHILFKSAPELWMAPYHSNKFFVTHPEHSF